MPIKPPLLDNRTYETLLDEARRRITRYTPEWTDFNPSDPGITLIELFAWMSDQLLWQMNQIPELNHRKFMDLLGIEQTPPVPATAHLTFTTNSKATVAPVARGAQVLAEGPDGKPLIFETDRDMDLVRPALLDVRVFDGVGTVIEKVNNATTAQPFWPFGPKARTGAMFFLGFGSQKENGDLKAPAFPPRIWLRSFLPEGEGMQDVVRRTDMTLPPPPVRLVWEFLADDATDRWAPLDVYQDSTVALTMEGDIAIEGPTDVVWGKLEEVDEDSRLWLRCRLVEGGYRVDREPKLTMLAPNTVSATNLATLEYESLGHSNGMPGQTFTLLYKPVQPASLELILMVSDGEGSREQETWTRVDDFLASGPDDTHFTLNAATGIIKFGNDAHGRIPEVNTEVIARRYRYGGGAAGNVGTDAITSLKAYAVGVKSVTNLRPAVGGRDMQSIEDLKLDVPQALRSQGRAVTAEDYEFLAAGAGGVLAAKVAPLHNPNVPDIEVPGALTVHILPDVYFGTALSPSRPPNPSPDLVAHICRQLDPYRMVTAEVYVAGAPFLEVRIDADVTVDPSFSPSAVRDACKEAINLHLMPFLAAPGNGGTAPTVKFGGSLYPNILAGVMEQVAGVRNARITAVYLNAHQQTSADALVRVPPCGLLWGCAEHVIHVRPDDES